MIGLVVPFGEEAQIRREIEEQAQKRLLLELFRYIDDNETKHQFQIVDGHDGMRKAVITVRKRPGEKGDEEECFEVRVNWRMFGEWFGYSKEKR